MLQYHDTVHSTPAGSTTKTTAVHDFSTSDGVWVVVVAVVPVSAVLLSQHIQIHTHTHCHQFFNLSLATIYVNNQ